MRPEQAVEAFDQEFAALRAKYDIGPHVLLARSSAFGDDNLLFKSHGPADPEDKDALKISYEIAFNMLLSAFKRLVHAEITSFPELFSCPDGHAYADVMLALLPVKGCDANWTPELTDRLYQETYESLVALLEENQDKIRREVAFLKARPAAEKAKARGLVLIKGGEDGEDRS